MAKYNGIPHETEKFAINQAVLAGVLKKYNPGTSNEVIGAIVRAMVGSGMAVADAAVGLAKVQRSGVRPATRSHRKQEAKVQPAVEPEKMLGEGLGELLPSAEDGMALLREIAVEVPLEDWAGELATPTNLCDHLGVSRSAISAWRSAGDVIALPKGKRGHVYPLHQFKDGRPISEIREILSLTSQNALVAWKWLMTPNVDFEYRTPLEVLREGDRASVLDAAHRSFD